MSATCKRHGPMVRREKPSEIAEWCGEWWDCARPDCHDSVLVPSEALKAQWAQGKSGQADLFTEAKP